MKHVLSRASRTRAVVGGSTALALAITALQGAPALALESPKPAATAESLEAVKGSPASAIQRAEANAPKPAPLVTADRLWGDFEVATGGAAKSESIAIPSVDGSKTTVIDGGWQELSGTGVKVASAGDPVATKEGAEQLARSKKGAGKAKGKSRADRVTVRFLDADSVKKLGVSGPVLEIKRKDGKPGKGGLGIRIPKEQLDAAFGGDFASRARWVQVDTSKNPSTIAGVVKAAEDVPAEVDTKRGEIVVAPTVAFAGALLMALPAAASNGGTGDFSATSLKPSAAWDVSAQTGTFSWSYGLRVPPAAAGPAPDLAISYDSQSVDGLTGSTNNQPSAIGEGWSLSGSGFIERSYIGCAVDDGASGPVKTSGDLCWKNANATVAFGGHSGELIQIAGTNQYRLSNDDGTRFSELKGAPCAANGTSDTACWQMITTDGTQYFFGLNQLPGYSSGKAKTNSAWTVPVFGNDVGEPCHASTFAASSCDLAWRWNLDYVVDVHGNAEAFYYNAQSNQYAKNGKAATSYVRGGELEHIEYGLSAATVYGANAASGKVHFSYDKNGRCSDSGGGQCTAQPVTGNAVKPANAAAYPDVPFDQLCTSGACASQISPTFWTTAKLSSVKTQVLKGGAYKDVDSWTLKQGFPATGDGTSAALWLESISHTGHVGGSLAEPSITFGGVALQNRVWAYDGLAPLNKYRVSSMRTELGATVSVNYSGKECTSGDLAGIFAAPQSNTKRCFPQWWSPSTTPPQAPQQDLFHKYVVTSVIDSPNTSGAASPAVPKFYHYGKPAWRYNDSPLTPADKRTWSVYAGYDTTEVREGDSAAPAKQSVTKYTFFRGLDGDRAAPAGGGKPVSVGGVADARPFAGRVREQVVTNGVGGSVVSRTTTTPWMSTQTANNGHHAAWYTGDAEVVVAEPVSTGGNRVTTTTTRYEGTWGLPASTQTVRSDAPTSCVTTAYAAANAARHIVGRVAEVLTTSGTCDQAASAGEDRLVSDVRTSYDGLAVGAAPSAGDATKVEAVTGFSGTTKTWSAMSATAYDGLGRSVRVTDALGRVSKTAYTPAGTGGPTTKVVTTNPLGWASTTEFDPAWGAVVMATDENQKVTTATYDALGRRARVWLPNRPASDYPDDPSAAYTYSLSQTAVSAITTETVTASGTEKTYTLVDGLGRTVQTQAAAIQSGSVVSDTMYDSQGRAVSSTKPYWATGKPTTTLFVPTNMTQVPAHTESVLDGVGRELARVDFVHATEFRRTSSTYPGADRVDVTPPQGGTPTTTITNSLSQKTKLIQYEGAAVSGAGLATTYEFAASGAMSSMSDPAGNRWTWQYDVLGNQIAANDPDSGRTTSSYDLAGNVLSTTDARGQVLSYVYDELNRKTAKYSGGTAGSLLASWTYDTVAKGKLSVAASYTGSAAGKPGLAYEQTTNAYDELYNPTSTSVKIPAGAPAFGGTTYTTSMAYNDAGRRWQRTLPAIGGLPAERLRIMEDGHGNEDSIQGTSMYGIATYTPIGQLSFISREGSNSYLATTFGYSAATGERNQVIDDAYVSSGWTKSANRLYSRNPAGDVTSIATSGSSGSETQCFSYGAFSALAEAWTPRSGDCAASPSVSGLGGVAPYWVSYGVDAATGNRTSSTAHTATGDVRTSYAYPAAGGPRPHAVSSAGGSAFSYDAAGNTVARPGQTLAWDESGKLSSVKAAEGSQWRVYDASGDVLVQGDPKAGSKLFLGETELTMAPGASAASAVRTYSLSGVVVAERSTVAGKSGSVLSWVSGDLNGTQDLSVVESTGEVKRRFVDPFGNPRGAGVSWGSEHGYLNAPVSGLTGLTQLGARAYDPVIGKFLSVDPVLVPDNPQQNNAYTYSANSPVTNSDPDGACYVGGGIDSLSFKSNCAGGSGLNAPAAYQAPAMAPSSSTGSGPSAVAKKSAPPSLLSPVRTAPSCGYWMPGCVAALPEAMSVGRSGAQILQMRRKAQWAAETFDDDLEEFLIGIFETTAAIGSAIGGPGGRKGGKGKGSPKQLQKLLGRTSGAVMPSVPPGTPLTQGRTPMLTNKMQMEAATRHGWSLARRPQGGPIFTDGTYYYSWDNTGHKGGIWKQGKSVDVAKSRIATLDDALKKVGD